MKEKKRLVLFPVILVILSMGFRPANAQTKFDFSGMMKVFLSAYVSENQRGPYFFHQRGDFAIKRIESRLGWKAHLSNKVQAAFRIDLFSSPEALFSEGKFPEAGILASPEESEPVELSLYEASIRVSDFLVKNLDLTVGKQRIPWGRADKLNVIDNLNPLDFANFLTFDPDYYLERRPQTAFNLEYYLFKDSRLQLVWLLGRQVSPLPAGFSEMLKVNLQSLHQPEVHLETKKPAIKDTALGLRFSTILATVDIGLSYYAGYFSLPYIYKVELNNPIQPAPSQVYFKYPKRRVFGLDFSGELKSVGWWLEIAQVQPERISSQVHSYAFFGDQPIPVSFRFNLMEDIFWQWVAGVDYTFSLADGLYLNFQFLHGLFDEAAFSPKAEEYFNLRKGMWFGCPGDYLAGKAELRLWRGDLRLAVNSLVECSSGHSSAIFFPALEYRIHDAVFFCAGAILSTGDQQSSKFGSFSRDRVIYLMTKLNF